MAVKVNREKSCCNCVSLTWLGSSLGADLLVAGWLATSRDGQLWPLLQIEREGADGRTGGRVDVRLLCASCLKLRVATLPTLSGTNAHFAPEPVQARQKDTCASVFKFVFGFVCLFCPHDQGRPGNAWAGRPARNGLQWRLASVCDCVRLPARPPARLLVRLLAGGSIPPFRFISSSSPFTLTLDHFSWPAGRAINLRPLERERGGECWARKTGSSLAPASCIGHPLANLAFNRTHDECDSQLTCLLVTNSNADARTQLACARASEW